MEVVRLIWYAINSLISMAFKQSPNSRPRNAFRTAEMGKDKEEILSLLRENGMLRKGNLMDMALKAQGFGTDIADYMQCRKELSRLMYYMVSSRELNSIRFSYRMTGKRRPPFESLFRPENGNPTEGITKRSTYYFLPGMEGEVMERIAASIVPEFDSMRSPAYSLITKVIDRSGLGMMIGKPGIRYILDRANILKGKDSVWEKAAMRRSAVTSRISHRGTYVEFVPLWDSLSGARAFSETRFHAASYPRIETLIRIGSGERTQRIPTGRIQGGGRLLRI